MTKQWLKMSEIYKIFAKYNENLDFSDGAAEEMFLWESEGKGDLERGIFPKKGKYNGYAVGKRLMDITVKMWKEDIENGLLAKFELYEDETLPNWWLNKVLKGMFMSPQGEKNRMELLNV